MATEAESKHEVREFRLEGAGLFVAAGALLALLVGAFWLGRWYERQTTPAGRAAGGPGADPLARVEEQAPAEASEGLTFFDTLSGDQKAAEPGREAAPPSAAPPGAPADAPRADAAADSGDYFVQVFAGRDRESAEALVRQLEQQGYRPQLASASEGSGRLFKVRVGGYDTREAAQSAAEKLRDGGYPGAWVTRAD